MEGLRGSNLDRPEGGCGPCWRDGSRSFQSAELILQGGQTDELLLQYRERGLGACDGVGDVMPGS